MHSIASVIIENSPERYREIRAKGLQVIHGEGTDAAVYKEIQLSPGNYVVVYTGSDEKNVEICSLLRKDLLHERIISRPGNSKVDNHLRQLGVETLDARRVLATTIENLILRPGAYHALIESFENYTVEDIEITNPDIDGKSIREVPLDKEAMLILVARGNAKDIPHGDTYLRTGDVITVFGTGSAISSIRKRFKAGP